MSGTPPTVTMPPRPLRDLLAGVVGASVDGDDTVLITGVVYDSRAAVAGSLFAALRGGYTDGHHFIAGAAERGAVVVLAEEPLDPPPGVRAVAVVPETRSALAQVAANFYEHPAGALTIIGVTGTNGKTTTTAMTAAVLDAGGFRAASLGTVDMKLGPRRWPNPEHQTTPESVAVQRFLRLAVNDGCTHAVLEATSHGLAMHRLDALPVDVAVLTNISHEHMEFHRTFEGYLAAKRILFERLNDYGERDRPRFAVANAEDPNAPAFLGATRDAIPLTYAVDTDATIRASDIREEDGTTAFTLHTPSGTAPVRLHTLGPYNVRNALAAAAVGHAQGLHPEAIAAGLAAWRNVTGHLEHIEMGQPFKVIVDFAHTPVAFAELLSLLHRTTPKPGRLIVVFGSAGERDTAKRAMQGEVTAKFADRAYFTNEDPRFENAMGILRQIAAGAERYGWRDREEYFCIENRHEAIYAAIADARAGDTVALVGKGHENSIIIGAEAHPWNEAEVARDALRALGYGEGDRR